MTALYNEIDPYAAQWLRNLIAAGHIADGVVCETSIVDLAPSDVAGFTQVHYFAGIGGWSLAARLAGWPDDRPLWTGSCPCQPFSVAGKGAGQEDVRHLWPEFFRLIATCRPDVVMGEQVAAAVGKSWLDGVCSDLEGIGYTAGAAVVPACAVDAPHRRDRLWFVADTDGEIGRRAAGNADSGTGFEAFRERPAQSGGCGSVLAMADADQSGSQGRFALRERGDEWPAGSHGVAVSNAERVHGDRTGHGASQCGRSTIRTVQPMRTRGFWSDSHLARGADGKARRVKPGVRLLAHGIPARVGKLRAFGNAIVPQVAAEIIGAYLDCRP